MRYQIKNSVNLPWIIALLFFFSGIVFGQLQKFEITPEKAPTQPAVFVNYPDDAAVIIYSSIDGLSFESNTAGIVETKTEPGKYTIIIKTEKQFLSVKKRNYMEGRITIPKLEPRQVLYYTITEKSPDAQVLPVSIITNPAGANIYLDGVYRGTETQHLISEGIHTVRVEKDGYTTIEKSIEVSKTSAFFEFKLEKVQEQLTAISSRPPGAFIYIDEKLQGGTTDKEMFLAVGDHILRLQKTGYIDTTAIITVSPDRKNHFVFDLIKNAGILDISISPPDAVLLINGENKSAGIQELPPAEYTIEVIKPGYIKQTDKLFLRLASKEVRSYNLIKNAAVLAISIIPADAELYIDQTKRTPGEIEVTPGKRIIEITKQKYIPLRDTVELKVGERITRKYALQSNTGTLTLTSNEKEFEFYINNKVTPFNSIMELESGRYEIRAIKASYYTFTKTVTINKGEKIAVSIKLDPIVGGIQVSVSPTDAVFSLLQSGSMRYTWVGASRKEDIMTGIYTLKVELVGYESLSEEITIEAKGLLKKDINLKKILTQEEINLQKGGKLLVQVEQSVAEVRLYLDGVLMNEWRGSRILEGLKEGTYDIEAYLDGYLTFRDDIFVEAGETNELTIKLEKIDLTKMTEKPWYAKWYTYVGGAVLGGGVAAILLVSKAKEQKAREQLVNPPVRPQ